MSGATCEIWTRDPEPKLIGYTNYAGSSDVIDPGFVDDIGPHWKSGGWGRHHACEHDNLTDAWAYSWYGGGDHWPVTVCLACAVVKKPLSPYAPDYGYGFSIRGWTPEQIAAGEAEEEFWRQFSADGWPKEGSPPGVLDMDDR